MAVFRTYYSPVVDQRIADHYHGRQYVRPSLANATLVSTGNGAWVLGAVSTIIAAGTTALPFDLVSACVSGAIGAYPPTGQVYEVLFFAGGVEICRFDFASRATAYAIFNILKTPVLAAGTAVTAQAMHSAAGGILDFYLAVAYHLHPV